MAEGIAQCLLGSVASGVARSPCYHLARRTWPCPPAFLRHSTSTPRFSPPLLLPQRRFFPLRSKLEEDKNLPAANSELDVKSTLDLFIRWEIPWDGKTVITTVIAFGASFLLTGLAVSILLARLGFRQRQHLDLDEQSLVIFINQILQTFVGTSVIQACIRSYSPLPDNLFNYDWRDPFSVSRGWLLWGVVGTFCGTAAVLLAGALTTYVNGEPLPREGQDALLQLLPLIGASRTSTALLLGVTGVLAPYLEETFFRGFLMTSLTKWVPTYVAVTVSAGTFALAHFTPGEIPQLFALGVVLGFSYSKTGSLLTPIMIHGLWNSGVLLLLTLLRLQGYDIQEMI
eukprot:c19412_g1_i2 orf=47-1075(+)